MADKDENVISMNDFKKEQKRRERAERRRKRLQWLNDNKEIVIPVVITVVSGSIAIGKGLIRSHNIKKQQDLKDLYIYNHSTGKYLRLKRPLKNSEQLIVEKRRKDGETLAAILSELKVLA